VSLEPCDGSAQNQDALDLAQSIHALLVAELRNLKADSDQRAIGDFRQYVAVKTYGVRGLFSRTHLVNYAHSNTLLPEKLFPYACAGPSSYFLIIDAWGSASTVESRSEVWNQQNTSFPRTASANST
jgi:hypothetical protein